MKSLEKLLSRYALCFCLLGLLLWDLASAAQTSADRSPQPVHTIAEADMDRSVQPGDDFFLYSNGGWIKQTVIPADRASVSVFSALDHLSNRRVAALIEETAKSSDKRTQGIRKISDLYRSYMDEAAIEAKGLTPLKTEFGAISAIRDKHDLARVLGENLRADVDPLNNTNYHTGNLIGLWAAPGFTDSDHYTAYLLQGGLEMPDREYYVKDSPQMQSVRAKYRTHVIAMLKLAGVSEPESRADRIITLEQAIAEKHWNLAEDQDVHKADNLWRKSDFATKAPGLDWVEFFRAAGLNSQETFIVWQSTAITGEAALVTSAPLETWKDWLTYHAIEDHADALPKALAGEHSAFFDGVLTGTEEQPPRTQRAVDEVNLLLGDEVGKLYAAKYFPPESKARLQAMVANIVAAFHKRIDALSWMTAATKAQAHAKLNALYVGIGYPETWRDYSALEIVADDLYGNEKRSELFEYRHALSRLGKPVDRQEWCMTPQTVNAVNLPLQNALNFPAAILEPPFFDPQAPDAVNYGAIGAIIGHEVSHAFATGGHKLIWIASTPQPHNLRNSTTSIIRSLIWL
jgi:putative endopeptidase